MDAQAQAFQRVVEAALSTDNDVRRQAEQVFQGGRTQPSEFFRLLTVLMVQSPKLHVRQFCAVMMRQNLAATSPMWEATPQQTQSLVMSTLLQLVRQEPSPLMRSKAADVISKLAPKTLPAGQWPQLLPFLIDMAQSPDPSQRATVLNVLTKLVEFCFDQLQPMLERVAGIALAGLQQHAQQPGTAAAQGGDAAATAIFEVRVAAVKLVTSLLMSLKPEQAAAMQPCLAPMCQVLAACFEAQDDMLIVECIHELIQIARVVPKFFQPVMESLVAMHGSMAACQELEEATRLRAFEFLVTLAETGKGWLRKTNGFVHTVINLTFAFLCSLEHTADWDSGKDEDDSDQQAYTDGCAAVHRLSDKLGGKLFAQHALPMVTQLAGANDWRQRAAALMCLSFMCASCKKVMKCELPNLVATIARFASEDGNVRVRYAALDALGSLAIEYLPTFQAEFGNGVLTVLLHALSDPNGHPRLLRQANISLVDFCAGIEAGEGPKTVAPFINNLLRALVPLLRHTDIRVQRDTLAAVSALACVSEEHFVAFYDDFMPGLRNILAIKGSTTELRELRARAIECVGMIGLSVGAEKFSQDAIAVMNLFVGTLQGNGAGTNDADVEDSDQQQAIRIACSRICKCLGEEFVPFLQHVVPPVLASAGRDCSFIVRDTEGASEEQKRTERELLEEKGYETAELNIRSTGVQSVSMNTEAITDCARGLEMIGEFAKHTGAHFMPYVEPCLKVCIEKATFFGNYEVRAGAICAIPHLLDCAKEYCAGQESTGGAAAANPMAAVQQLFDFALPAVMMSLSKEGTMHACNMILDTLAEMLGCCVNPLRGEQIDAIHGQVRELLEGSAMRMADIRSRRAAPDFDETEAELLQDENDTEEELRNNLRNVIDAMARCCGPTYPAAFQAQLHTFFWAMVTEPDRDVDERMTSLCILYGVVENGMPSPVAVQYANAVLPVAVRLCQDPDVDMRQIALYTVGVCSVAMGAQAFDQFKGPTLQLLLGVINAPGARADKEVGVLADNAISSFGMIAHKLLTPSEQAQALPQWLSWLPLTYDREEAQKAHERMVVLVEENNPAIVNEQGLRKVVEVLGQALAKSEEKEEGGGESSFFTEGGYKRAASLWAKLKQSGQAEKLAVGLPEDARQALVEFSA